MPLRVRLSEGLAIIASQAGLRIWKEEETEPMANQALKLSHIQLAKHINQGPDVGLVSIQFVPA